MRAWIIRPTPEPDDAADGQLGLRTFALCALCLEESETVEAEVERFLRNLPRRPVDTVSATFRATLRCLTNARTILIEDGYFDLDTRSEDAITLERQFRFDRPLSLRLHFFSAEITKSDFTQWQIDGTIPASSESDDLNLGGAYLGYVIPRSHRGALTVGRTLIRPPESPPGLDDRRDLPTRVRTLVQEEVNLYGVRLYAQGVPFMQQDGALLSCAHVTAWMAHLTQVLRGIVPRVSIGQLREAGSLSVSDFGRQYPSRGLFDSQILRALGDAGVAPEIIYIADLDRIRSPQWYDRPALHTLGNRVKWQHENFTATLGRYLNSGLPVILNLGEHSVLVCGYLRDADLNPKADAGEEGASHPDGLLSGAVDGLVVHDEAEGPYIVKTVDGILADVPDDGTLLVPLPPGLALSGSDAEQIGAEAFREHCERLRTSTAELVKLPGGTECARAIAETIAAMDKHELAVRTYAAWGTDFKASLSPRGADGELVRQIASMRLPRFVWVVEVIDRALREHQYAPVIGEVLIDATATSLDQACVLCVRAPGHLEMQDPVTSLEGGRVIPKSMHASGRWAQKSKNVWWYGSISQRSKVAGALR